jgi:DNA mismatch repair ATPase MutS
MAFSSILFANNEDRTENRAVPDFFLDLNLDQIVDAVTAEKTEYNLKPFFYTPLHRIDAILYRHEIIKDLENNDLFLHITWFAKQMRRMREHLAKAVKLYYPLQKKSWFLDAAAIYCEAVQCLLQALMDVEITSRGFLALRAYLNEYVHGSDFVSLLVETQQLKKDLSEVRYCLHIKDNCIRVSKYKSSPDYSADVEAAFDKFKQGAVKNYLVDFHDPLEMNHIEAKILELVAQLFPEIFSDLDSYVVKYSQFRNPTLETFDREIQFYIAWLEYIALFKQKGFKFCYPQITDKNKEVYDYDSFDLALARKLMNNHAELVCNDFSLQDQERILVISGPNQGGKTTFARTFGQLHYLACLGCTVPGRAAQLFLFDMLFTHFEREETIQNLSGKLQDDLVRMNHILSRATPNSIVIMNEIFTSTTLRDATFLSKKIMDKIIQLDLLCVCVTFIDEMASFSEQVVSMVSTVVPENPDLRTYKIIRKPADGLSYAISIARKYHLTYDCIKERIKS